MNLDDLNSRVTNAILRAEALPAKSWEAQSAFREVADLEEGIASIAGAQTAEGEIARLGAVAASLNAGDPLRTIQLAERYLADALSAPARHELEELRREADAEILRGIVDEPSVAPIRFKLRAV